MMLTRYLMAMLLAACWVSPAPADQNDRRLDGLFAQLQSTGDQAEAGCGFTLSASRNALIAWSP